MEGASLDSSGAKVAWSDVLKPFEEGGLGIKDPVGGNKALCIKHIWHLFKSKGNSLWVDWVHCFHLRQRSFWFVKIPPNCAWCWRKILK